MRRAVAAMFRPSRRVHAVRELHPPCGPHQIQAVDLPQGGDAVTNVGGAGPVRVQREPLYLVEEIPAPPKQPTNMELITTAWTDSHARQLWYATWLLRLTMGFLISVFGVIAYRLHIANERRLLGVANVPEGMRIGAVVYLDLTLDGFPLGRVVIGLLTEQCPLYCEYFHRRCTGNGGRGPSFRGLTLKALFPGAALVFGEGRRMEHGVQGLAPTSLPTEYIPGGPWRGAVSSIALAEQRESPNFALHMCGGDFETQVFAIVLAGYDHLERISRTGLLQGNTPRHEVAIEDCGELCTLSSDLIVPLPWKLYSTVSDGFNAERFGSGATANKKSQPTGPRRERTDGGVRLDAA